MTNQRSPVLLTTLLLVVGCSSADTGGSVQPATSTIGYVGPVRPTPIPDTIVVAEPEAMVRARLLSVASALPGSQARQYDREGVVVLTYSGEPRDFVDCGSIVVGQPGTGLRTVQANAPAASFQGVHGAPDGRLDRRMRLDARSVVRLDPVAGNSTMVAIDTTYVVTREFLAYRPGGEQGGTRETIAFSAGELGEFSKGTTCRATGRLEDLIAGGGIGGRVIYDRTL
jgi:hypothetical protein